MVEHSFDKREVLVQFQIGSILAGHYSTKISVLDCDSSDVGLIPANVL